ncbi:melatonin receptor type 1A-like [Stylophora pistillata]|uniref:melatonin receptor type 1A-like n=1 Tax=Stylophora pistillata TaxID=50429 RepID=UPI000C04F09F|nr:melatonin receptor type 1A-like [Stylophora pistillata]
MPSMRLPDRCSVEVIFEAIIFLVMPVISVTGNTLVLLAVYKNPKLRLNTNLYILALAASDLVCATVEMPIAATTVISGKWNLSDGVCQFQGFVDVFVTYVNPATMGLTAFNRYMRIVKTRNYNKIFSPRKSKVWLTCVWMSLALYLVIARATNWNKYQFIIGYALCSITFTTRERKFVHYCIVFGLYSILPFVVACFSYWKVFSKLRHHKRHVLPSLENTVNPRSRVSAHEINISRALLYIAAGFLLSWIPLWIFAFWKRLSPETVPRLVELGVVLMLFLSATINPFIYTANSRVFRREIGNLLCWWKVRSTREVNCAVSDKNVGQEMKQLQFHEVHNNDKSTRPHLK